MAKFDSKTFNPEAFGVYVERVPNTKRNELIKSGVLKGNEAIRNTFSNQSGTAYATLPMYGLLDGDPLNYDGETDITSTSTTTFQRSVVVVGRAKAWVEGDFAYDITGGADFMSNVGNQVASYWENIYQRELLHILNGIFSMTGNSGNTGFVTNHTYDISGDADEAKQIVGATTLNSAAAKATGDNKSNFKVVIMHSTIATNLENLKVLKYFTQTDAEGINREIGLATWNGRTVFIDDSMPVEVVPASGTDPEYTKYTTYILGTGSIDYEDIGAKVPYEMARDPKTNGGLDTLYTRKRFVYSPYGISYTKKNQVTLSPTSDELEDGANWELVNNGVTGAGKKYIDHKAIAIARIISRG
ncbi:Uncharacterised protein [Sebaldella termitidis]|uniref:Phage coat protein n=1 Tax=Sebaldella termitidis (strain ATCC 33386 / NCTC 11300) TaxID=526218 RepID=D1AHQ9_SEBTE|nr:hypothetical protein [Sebaldella termitidis]ACZ08293.1 hypothetical protein Sterm_1431 [Sebaldella termitidis ATCC 33386]SUI23603.1 Uncharacterised protein [Sebaldella termitidis]